MCECVKKGKPLIRFLYQLCHELVSLVHHPESLIFYYACCSTFESFIPLLFCHFCTFVFHQPDVCLGFLLFLEHGNEPKCHILRTFYLTHETLPQEMQCIVHSDQTRHQRITFCEDPPQ